jgi:hypothetical protein
LIFLSLALCCASPVWAKTEIAMPYGEMEPIYRFPGKYGSGDITSELQEFINKIPSGVLLIPAGDYEVSNVVKITKKTNLFVLFEPGAKLRIAKHGYGIFEITDSSNIKISGGQLEGAGRFLSKNYGNQAGGGEKKAAIATWGYRRNGEENKYGTYNGGFVGNAGIGILIRYGCSDITIENVEISHFNYAGVQTGFLGDSSSLQSQYSRNISVKDCYIHDNYGCGISIHAAEDVLVENNVIENIGSPEASEKDYELNPGYGIALRLVKGGGFHGKRVNIVNNRIRSVARKGIDAHSGENIVISGNYVEGALVVGISLKGSSGVGKSAVIKENTVIDSGIATGARVDAKIGISTAFSDTKIINNKIINSGRAYSMYCEAAGCHLVGNHVTNDTFVSGRPIYARGYGDTVIKGVDISNNIIQGKFNSPVLLKNISNSRFVSNFLNYENKSLKLYELVNCTLEVRDNSNVSR